MEKVRVTAFKAVKIRGEFYLSNGRRAIKLDRNLALFDGNPLSYVLQVGERKKIWATHSNLN